MVRLDAFTRFVTFLRWITAAVGLGWTILLDYSLSLVIASLVVTIYAAFRSLRPLEYRHTSKTTFIELTVEVAIALGAVIVTGAWSSPFMFCLFVPLVAAGLSLGASAALLIAGVQTSVLSLLILLGQTVAPAGQVITWSGELFLIAAVASYGRTLLSRAEAISRVAERRTRELAHANAMLADLDRMSRDLSVSLDSRDAIQTSLEQIVGEIPCDVAIVLLSRADGMGWEVAAAHGIIQQRIIPRDELPAQAAAAALGSEVTIGNFLPDDRDQGSGTSTDHGFDPASRFGLYAPLIIRSHSIGFIALERKDATPFSQTEAVQCGDLAHASALTIDNARCFERLQTRGAARERIRIARDLHDRLGQSMAYVAFELDRLRTSFPEQPLALELTNLRDDARTMLGELRETLSDLRTDVNENVDLAETIAAFLQRVERRSGIETTLQADAQPRFGIGRQRELWRITQEAVANAERHADASIIRVTLHETPDSFCLTIEDDGTGYTPNSADGQHDLPASYGIAGMHERAELLGGHLSIEPRSPKGTTVMVQMLLSPKEQANPQRSSNQPQTVTG